MKQDNKNLAVLTTTLVASFVIFLKAQFQINIVPEFNDFSAIAILYIFTVVGIVRNNRKSKKKKSS